MSRAVVLDILNDLLAFEQRNLVSSLMESTVFVSRVALDDLALVERLAGAGREHAQWLAAAVAELGGVPGPRRIDPAMADLHYQELHHALPRLLADREALVHRYEAAVDRVGEEPRAAKVVTRIVQRHRDELALLQERSGRPAGAT